MNIYKNILAKAGNLHWMPDFRGDLFVWRTHLNDPMGGSHVEVTFTPGKEEKEVKLFGIRLFTIPSKMGYILACYNGIFESQHISIDESEVLKDIIEAGLAVKSRERQEKLRSILEKQELPVEEG